MKKNIFYLSVLMVTVFSGTAAFAQITIPGIIDASNSPFICSNANQYLINGKVYVKAGGSIVFEEGVVVKGVKKPTPAEASALVITRGGTIDCQGTNVRPVVFTSNEPTPKSGDWGGIVLLGSAPLNRADTSIEGIDLPSLPAGIDVFYGGGGGGAGNPDQSSGVIRYARIEYAGANVTPNAELNGLTFGGVGRGTEVDFVQVIYGTDDAFEFFGGTVNAKHLIGVGNDDDSWDFDFGYNGHLQFVVSVLSATKPSYSSDPNGIESDNDNITSANSPRTNATITNMTTIGMEDLLTATSPAPARVLLNGARFRRNSSFTVRNSIFMGFPTGVRFDAGGVPGSPADVSRFQNNIVHGFTTTDNGASIDASNTEILGDQFNSNQTVQLTDPFNITLPDFRPSAASPAVSGANFTGLTSVPATFFSTTTYRGAFSTSQNWAATWARFFSFPL